MFTLFDALKLISVLFFTQWGASIGLSYSLIWGGVGGVAGAAVGLILGNAPFVIAMVFLSRKNDKTTTEELRENFADSTGFFTGFSLLAELMKREEDIERETEIVITRMTSDIQIHRKVAWDCLRLIKPEMADRFPDYDPNLSLEQSQEKLGQILDFMRENHSD